jgi:hypothetical protein
VTETIEKDGKLMVDRGLRICGTVDKNWIVMDEGEEEVECGWVYAKIFTES